MPDTDNGVYSAADAAKDLETEESTDQEETTAEAEEPTTTDVTADEDDTDEVEEPAEDEEPDLPELDSKIVDALGDNTEAVELWKRQWKGIEKRERRLAEQQQAVSGLVKYAQGLSDPSTASQTLQEIIDSVAEGHGLTREQILGLASLEPDNGQTEWERAGFHSDREYELHKELQALKADLTPLKTAEAERRREAEDRAYVQSQTTRVAKQIAGQYDGFEVTASMLKTAVQNLPQFRDEPAKAVRMWYADELVKHAQGKTASRHKKLPEMLDTSSAKGFDIPDNLDEYSAEHAAREVGAF
jgi:hypothetical protein